MATKNFLTWCSQSGNLDLGFFDNTKNGTKNSNMHSTLTACQLTFQHPGQRQKSLSWYTLSLSPNHWSWRLIHFILLQWYWLLSVKISQLVTCSGIFLSPSEKCLKNSGGTPECRWRSTWTVFSMQTIEWSCILSSQKTIITFARQAWSVSSINNWDGLINWHWNIKQLTPSLC